MSIYRMATVDVPTYEETTSDSYTKLLLHCDGTNGSTTFTDKTGKTITRYGDAQISTAQSKFRGASAKFDGTGDYLSAVSSADFNCSGDFTFDAWINPSAWSATYNCLFSTGATGGFWIGQLSVSGRFGLRIYNGTDICYVASLPSLNTWTHIAVVRSGSTVTLYINGVSVATVTSSNNFPTAAAYVSSDGGGSNFNGYVDELRFSKGIARWTANFTPPTAPYDTTITQTPTNTNVVIAKQYRGLSGVNREIKEQYRGYSGVNRLAFGLPKTYLYNLGNECTTLTGGWSKILDSYGNGVLTKNASNMVLSCSSSTSAFNMVAVIANIIDITPFSTLKILCDITIYSTSACAYRLQLPTNKTSVVTIDSTQQVTIDMVSLGVGTFTNQVLSSDVSSINTSCYATLRNAQVEVGVQNAVITVHQMWLE